MKTIQHNPRPPGNGISGPGYRLANPLTPRFKLQEIKPQDPMKLRLGSRWPKPADPKPAADPWNHPKSPEPNYG